MTDQPGPVTAQNWGFAPHNRWSFQHVQELFPTCRLARDPSPGWALPVESQDVRHVSFAGAAGQQLSLGDFLRASCCDAFLVAHHGRLIAEHYFDGMTAGSHHLLNSVTKSFVGMLAGIAVERGQLDTAALVTRYVPELDTAAWRGTTVRHVLDMTAGVQYAEDYADPGTDFWREAAVVGWRPALVDAETPASLLDYARSRAAQDMENGAKFHYRTLLTNVIGMVLERATGVRLATLLEAEIWSKLATRHDAAIVVDRTGFPYVGAGMNACARDLVNFGLMMIHDGVLNGRQVVPAAWIADTAAGDDAARQCFARGDYGAVMQGWYYRNQVWVAGPDPRVMLAIGIHGQLVWMDRARDLVIVVLSSQPQPLDLMLFMDTFAAMQALGSELHGVGVARRVRRASRSP